MKKILIIILILTALVATPVLAVSSSINPFTWDFTKNLLRLVTDFSGSLQVLIRTDDQTATTTSALLEVVSSSTPTFYINRGIQMTVQDTPSAPPADNLYLYVKIDSNDLPGLFVQDDESNETQLGAGGGGGGGCTTFNCLSDVIITAAAAVQVIFHNGVDWINQQLGFSNLSGNATVVQGGTNITTYTTGDILYSSATDVLSRLSIGATGRYLRVTGGLPSWDTAVDLETDQTIAGVKIFSSIPYGPSSNPTNDDELSRKGYVDAVAKGLSVRSSVLAGSVTDVTLSGEQTIDDVALVSGDRVLLKDQTTASQNGIWLVDVGAWSRATDYDETSEVIQGSFMTILGGTDNGNEQWVLVTANPIDVGTTDLVFSQLAQQL